jgi:hypothetical protein
MTSRTVIAAASNILPAAFASLHKLGYVVTLTNSGRLCKAENANNTFVAEDPLLLLGLVKLHEERGDSWQPTEAEVEAYLSFDAAHIAVSSNERADVWEDQGGVHILCVTAFGDPVELSTTEASEFAARLAQAISKAE